MSEHPRIFLNPPHQTGQETIEIQKVLHSNYLAPVGQALTDFEQDLGHQLHHASGVVALNSGTSAIHLALRLLDVGPGDIVLCPTFTFAGAAFPIMYLGAVPVFIDSAPQSVNLDPQLLETAIQYHAAKGQKPKAIIAVHLYGFPYQVTQINALAERYDIPIVEDAAEALGARYQGSACGRLGTMGVLSFNGNKIITTSSGGALVTPSPEMRQRALYLAQQAKDASVVYHHTELGYNYRMSNLCAALGRAQLKGLNLRLQQKKQIHQRYIDLANQYEGISIYTLADHLSASNNAAVHDSDKNRMLSHTSGADKPTQQEPNYWLNILRLDPAAGTLTPAQVIDQFDAHNIEARHVWKPMHLQPVFARAKTFLNGSSAHWFEHSLCLPSGTAMDPAQWNRIEAVFKACFAPK